jgi:transposase
MKGKLKSEGSPMKTKYIVELNSEQRACLEKISSTGTYPARQIKRAQILLKSDQKINWSYKQISEAFDVSDVTIAKVRKAFKEQGLQAALQRKKPDREYEQIVDGEAEAHLIAIACSQPPEGQARWTLRLLQSEMIKRSYVDEVSHETIRAALKKTNLNLG